MPSVCLQLEADPGRWQAHSLLEPLMVLLVDRLGDGNARGAQKGIRKGKKGKSVEENDVLLKASELAYIGLL